MPVAIVTVVSVATYSTVGDVLMSVVVPGQVRVTRVIFCKSKQKENLLTQTQSFASVLVMYQIALGKATCERLEKRNLEEV